MNILSDLFAKVRIVREHLTMEPRMRESLRRLFTLPGEVRVYPGHGPSTTIGDERSRYRL